MSRNKLPQHIVGAIRRRAAAAEKFFLADSQVSEYCKSHGINTDYINGNVETVTNFNADFFIRDIEERLAKKAHE